MIEIVFYFLRKISPFIPLSKALSSQLEAILDKEQEQNITDANSESGGGGAKFWNSDETYEDYYNEGTHGWSFVSHVVVVVIVFVSLVFISIDRCVLIFI